MNKKYLILSLLLVFFISAGQSLGENANNSSIIAVADLKYIWSVTGIESEKYWERWDFMKRIDISATRRPISSLNSRQDRSPLVLSRFKIRSPCDFLQGN